jgi:hypothetical protein
MLPFISACMAVDQPHLQSNQGTVDWFLNFLPQSSSSSSFKLGVSFDFFSGPFSF